MHNQQRGNKARRQIWFLFFPFFWLLPMRMFRNVDQARSSGEFMANFFHYRSCKSLHAMGRATHTHKLVYNTKNNMHFEKFAPPKQTLVLVYHL